MTIVVLSYCPVVGLRWPFSPHRYMECWPQDVMVFKHVSLSVCLGAFQIRKFLMLPLITQPSPSCFLLVQWSLLCTVHTLSRLSHQHQPHGYTRVLASVTATSARHICFPAHVHQAGIGIGQSCHQADFPYTLVGWLEPWQNGRKWQEIDSYLMCCCIVLLLPPGKGEFHMRAASSGYLFRYLAFWQETWKVTYCL